MYGLRAWQPFEDALAKSAYTTALRNRAELRRITHDLIQMYEGNQLPYIESWLRDHTSDEEILRVYLKLAAFQNIVKMLVDRTSVVSLVRVVWTGADGRPDAKATDNWKRLTQSHLSTTWDAFTQLVDRRRNLCKTAVACVGWDARSDKMTLAVHTADDLDVGYVGADDPDESVEAGFDPNENKLEPDRFWFIREAATGWTEAWDFSSRETGPSGVRRVRNGDGWQDFPGAFRAIDPRTQRSVVPFVAFRTIDNGAYFVWDNQDHLVQSQEFFNRAWTRISVLSEMGANKIPLLMGDGWADKEGRIKALLIDLLRPLKQPQQDMGQANDKPLIAFVGPEVESLINGQLDLADECVQLAAACIGVAASTIRAKNEAKSGYALQIEGSSLVRKHNEDVQAMGEPYRRLVEVMRLYWNTAHPEYEISDGVQPSIVIPQSHSIVTTREAVDADIAMTEKGLKRPLPVIFNAEPGIPAETAYQMADRFELRTFPPVPAAASGAGPDRNPAGAALPPSDPPAAPAGGTP